MPKAVTVVEQVAAPVSAAVTLQSPAAGPRMQVWLPSDRPPSAFSVLESPAPSVFSLLLLGSLTAAVSKRLTNPLLVASSHQSREVRDPDKFCSLCHATFNDPVMAQQHYVGKKHRKQETKLKLMAHYGRLADPAVTDSAGKETWGAQLTPMAGSGSDHQGNTSPPEGSWGRRLKGLESQVGNPNKGKGLGGVWSAEGCGLSWPSLATCYHICSFVKRI